MKNKIIFLALALIVTISLFQACSKEEVGGDSETIQNNEFVDTRNGEFTGVYYLNSNSFAFPQKNTQIAFNADSIVTTDFRRSAGPLSSNFTKVLGTLDPSYQNKPARRYDITITLRDTVFFFPRSWIKDTTAVSFSRKGSINLVPGVNSFYKTNRSETKMQYYDTTFKKLKDKFEYQVQLDNITYKDDIPATNTGTVFWLNHKM
jgi:hypothetical protein